MSHGLNSEQRPPADADLLTVEEAAKRLRIGRTKMYRLLGSGEVESITVGRSRRIPPECLAEFVRARRRKQAQGEDQASAADAVEVLLDLLQTTTSRDTVERELFPDRWDPALVDMAEQLVAEARRNATSAA